jgi:ABC-type branched-subunit amino acid transport system permease subunit
MRWRLAVLAAILLLYPWLAPGAFYERMGAELLLAAIGASAWNLVGGYAGQISVGHAIFFGIGAYAPLLGYTHWGLPPIAGIPVGILLSLAVATIIGLPTFRLQGHYFSMATIAVAELIRICVSNWDFVGAAIGMMGRRCRAASSTSPSRAPFLTTICSLRCWPSSSASPGGWSAAAWAITSAPSAAASVRRAASACRCAATSSSPCS